MTRSTTPTTPVLIAPGASALPYALSRLGQIRDELAALSDLIVTHDGSGDIAHVLESIDSARTDVRRALAGPGDAEREMSEGWRVLVEAGGRTRMQRQAVRQLVAALAADLLEDEDAGGFVGDPENDNGAVPDPVCEDE